MKWNVIDEETPKNTAMILFDGETVGEGCRIEYVDGPNGWYWADEQYQMSTPPTHWMPLPHKPSGE